MRWLVGGFLVVGLLVPGHAVAQEDDPPDEVDQSFGTEDESGSEQQVDLNYIDDLLEDDVGVLEGSGFSYDDGDRRDPFFSLLQVADRPEVEGPRPEGIPGLLIDEVTVTGVWVTADGPVAQVQAANKAKSFLLRPGDQLYDGDVVRITYERYAGAEVVFKQILDDPTAPKPFREVVRRLEP